MAITNRVASSMAEALALTPHQIITVSRALARVSQPAQPRPRRGTPDEFKAMILSMAAG